MPTPNPRPFWPSFKKPSARGQVIIEYILLLLVAMAVATIIMRTVVQRDSAEPGFLMKRWQGMMTQIGSDDPNKRGQ